MHRIVVAIPGWKPLLAFGLPVLIGTGAVAGAYVYSASARAATIAPTVASGGALNLPPPAGLLVDVTGAVVGRACIASSAVTVSTTPSPPRAA